VERVVDHVPKHERVEGREALGGRGEAVALPEEGSPEAGVAHEDRQGAQQDPAEGGHRAGEGVRQPRVLLAGLHVAHESHPGEHAAEAYQEVAAVLSVQHLRVGGKVVEGAEELQDRAHDGHQTPLVEEADLVPEGEVLPHDHALLEPEEGIRFVIHAGMAAH